MALSKVIPLMVPVAFIVVRVLKELHYNEGSCANLGHPQRAVVGDLQ